MSTSQLTQLIHFIVLLLEILVAPPFAITNNSAVMSLVRVSLCTCMFLYSICLQYSCPTVGRCIFNFTKYFQTFVVQWQQISHSRKANVFNPPYVFWPKRRWQHSFPILSCVSGNFPETSFVFLSQRVLVSVSSQSKAQSQLSKMCSRQGAVISNSA